MVALQQYLPFTVLKQQSMAYPIRTFLQGVATVLTVYGIETGRRLCYEEERMVKLQQYLPFTVLKLS